LLIIADFISKIGGEEALNKINSYALKGNVEINASGSKLDMQINVYRQKPDRYGELLSSSAAGEIRQIYNGKTSFIQADYGVNRDSIVNTDTAEIEIFAPLYSLFRKDSFKSFVYQGAYAREGRKAHVIEAVTKENHTIALAFDVESKLLVSYTAEYYGISFGDYRTVDKIMLPFHINRERMMNIKLDEIKLNPAIEASVFMKKENCFDKVD
jgi:outer membrane lipoprotein-sorting protein